ncbi:hypothetical protein [Methyloprofundus sp.]|uniref:hypothetical protein n=1 Tax=Methyloprofundus sp. TaxID=2020875 RepID=UPI003D11FE82
MNVVSKLSIIIPVGPDDNTWQYLLKELTVLGEDIEIILSACQALPKDFNLPDNIIWMHTTQGRARQLNVGATQASRPVIWFLHADTRFTVGVIDALHNYIAKDKQGMGYFRLKFAKDGPQQIRLNAWAANVRSRLFGLPFGDQGFIMRKSLFEHMHGFDESLKIGEDLDFAVRVRANDFSLIELPAELMTSARRYKQNGWLLTTSRHIYLTWTLTRQAKHRLTLS